MLKSASARLKIRSILLTEWDPLGIKNDPEAHNEYDSYIRHIESLLMHNSDARHISEFLLRVERDQMGLSGDFMRAESVSKSIACSASNTEVKN